MIYTAKISIRILHVTAEKVRRVFIFQGFAADLDAL